MFKIIIKLLILSCVFLGLTSCGGSGGGDSKVSINEGSDGTGTGTGTGTGSGTSPEHEPVPKPEGYAISKDGKLTLNDSENGKFAELKIVEFSLPDNLTNARENTGVSRYIGRTAMRYQGSDAVKVPMRSYVAHCVDSFGKDNLFVSMSLQEGVSGDDRTGSVYQLQYNASSGFYEPTNNSIVLTGVCNESHGVAVSDDCSRVAVLCETDYNKSAASPLVIKDIAKTSGVKYFNQADNGAFISGWSDISDMMDYIFDYPDWADVFTSSGMPPIADVLAELQSAYPNNGYDANTTYKNLDNNNAVLEVVEQSAAVQANKYNIINGFRDFLFVGRDEMWLLEWNYGKLDDSFDAYVVAKNAGNSMSSMNLLYVENDREGRSSYAFTAETTQFFGAMNNHTAAAQFVIDRNTWSINLDANGFGRGWFWDCVNGHDFLTRTIYNPYSEMFASLCTSDTTYDGNPSRMIGGGNLGTIGVKRETSSSLVSGKPAYYTPSHASPVLNGGGHTVVQISSNQSMLALAAPQLVTPTQKQKYVSSSSFINYVEYRRRDIDINSLTDDQKCWEYHAADIYGGCDIAIYYSDAANDEGLPIDIHVNSPLWGTKQTLDPQYYTRVGIRLLDGNYRPGKGLGVKWVAGDTWDLDSDGDVVVRGEKVGDGTNGTVVLCTYGDPQLVDLENGRYLMGYAKYICSDHKFNKDSRYELDNYFTRIGGTATLFPQAYYLVEIDAQGNILEGPVELKHDVLGDIGWGSIDEMIPLGNGKAGWVYKPNPTIDNSAAPVAPLPLSNEWRVMVYESEN
ncbi:MAG: hypothetical protein GY808_15785 [Gammaproteobacteria bacterium]|nr:hypothetical protein [Gammaproteobacteria bacterium]